MFWGWFKRAVKRIWGLIAPSVKKYAREGLEDFLEANIDVAFEILLETLSEFPNLSFHELAPVVFNKLKQKFVARNLQVADSWISRLILDSIEHLKGLQERGEAPAIPARP